MKKMSVNRANLFIAASTLAFTASSAFAQVLTITSIPTTTGGTQLNVGGSGIDFTALSSNPQFGGFAFGTIFSHAPSTGGNASAVVDFSFGNVPVGMTLTEVEFGFSLYMGNAAGSDEGYGDFTTNGGAITNIAVNSADGTGYLDAFGNVRADNTGSATIESVVVDIDPTVTTTSFAYRIFNNFASFGYNSGGTAGNGWDNTYFRFTFSPVAVPEPTTSVLGLLGAIGFLSRRRR